MNEFQVAKERNCKEIVHYLRPFYIKLYTRNTQSSQPARLQCSALLFLVEENHNYRFDRMNCFSAANCSVDARAALLESGVSLTGH
jgi:hypothetical protein